MSVMMSPDDTLRVIALSVTPAHLRRSIWAQMAQQVAEVLHTLNVEALRQKYGVDADRLITQCTTVSPEDADRLQGALHRPMTVLRQAMFYEYQCCEHSDWRESEAKRYCDEALRIAIAALPGIDAFAVLGIKVTCLLCGAEIGTGHTSWGGNWKSALRRHLRRCETATNKEREHYIRTGRWPRKGLSDEQKDT